MCTLVTLFRPDHPWPLIVAGNRDEMRDRPALPPARHWHDRPEVVAGRDQLAGGSWLGLNDHGVIAVVMNREGSLGPEPGKRSRGELVLEALDHAEAAAAADALGDLNPAAYRPFNLVIGDPRELFWLRHAGSGPIEVQPIAPGLHLLASGELDDPEQPRIRHALPRFRQVPAPEPERDRWGAWTELLGSRGYAETDGPTAALNIALPSGFGTVSSHLVAVPRRRGSGPPARFLYCDGPPDRAPFRKVLLAQH